MIDPGLTHTAQEVVNSVHYGYDSTSVRHTIDRFIMDLGGRLDMIDRMPEQMRLPYLLALLVVRSGGPA